MKRRTIKGIVAAIGIIQALSTSCDVGLGSAVDTQAPGITIERPEVDMVIRDKFVMSGEWNDDGVIDSVYVMVKRTDGNPVNNKGKDGAAQSEVRIDGSFEKDLLEKEKGTWKAEVDPFDEANPIPDGTYQATIYIKDKGNHTTTQSTTFTVDNTPPVLILTKPASKPGDSTISKYGKRLFLEGKVADSTKETWIEIKYYNRADCSEESLLSTMQTQLIAPTDVNSNNAKLASFSEDLGDELAREYFDIYKDENGGDKEGKAGTSTVYAALTVYDTAETCKEESAEAEAGGNGKVRGNSTGTFYFSKELSSSITKSKESGGYGLAPTDIYNILNGNYEIKDSSRAVEAKKVSDELKELRKDREGERDITVFTINPENSPYFTVSGLKTLSDQSMAVSDNGYFLINGAMTLEISVFMGSDSIEIDSDSEDFYAYLLESDEYGEPLENAQPLKLYSKARESGSGKNKKTYYEIGGKEEHQTTTGAYVFSVPMAKTVRVDPDKTGNDGIVATGIEYGKNYVIRVSGKDMEDNPVEVYDTGYGFHFTSGGGAPELEIEEPHEGTLFIKKGEGVTFFGRAKTEEGVAEVTVWNGSTKLTDLELLTKDDGVYNKFSGSVGAEKFDQEEGGIYTLTVKAAAGGDNEGATEYQRTIWYDVEEPKASNIKVSEKKEGEEAYKDSYTDGQNYFVNNKKKIISISGIATDNVGLESAVLKVSGEGGKKIEKTETENPGKWSFEGIDLRDWSGDEAEAELILEDKSGNKSSTKIKIKFDVTAPEAEHKIDDSSKDLAFRIGDYENDAGESDVGGKYSFGTYGSALTMQIRGSYPDNEGGSGINKIYYKVFEDEVTIDKTKNNEQKEGGKIYFKSLDDLKEYVIAHKTDTFTPLASKETRHVEYNIKPGSLPAAEGNTVNRYGGEAVNGYSVNSKGYVQFRTAVESNYKATIKGFQEGKNYLVLVAEDNAGNTSVDYAEVPTPEDPAKTAVYPCYSLNVDITAPNIPSKNEGTVYTNLKENTPVYITGTVSDKSGAEDGSSGLKKIVFTGDQNDRSVTVEAAEFTVVPDPADPTLRRWRADVSSLLSSDGTAIISARVSDNAGYETSVPVANVMVDKTGPTVVINSPAGGAMTGKTVTVSGTAADGNGAGVNTEKPMVLYYTKNEEEGWEEYAGEVTAAAGGSWNCSFDAGETAAEGENTVIYLKVSATDKAGEGNTGYSEPVMITVDRKKPVIADTESGIGNVKTAEAVNGHWYNATTLKVSGEYTDEEGSGVKTVYYQAGNGEAAGMATADGTYSINVSDLEEGTNTLKVKAEDAAGNMSEETEYTFNIDSIQPVIEEVTGAESTDGEEDLELTVRINDEHPAKPVVVVRQNGTAIQASESVEVTEAEGSGSTYTSRITLPFKEVITADGVYDIEIQETDKAGNRAVAVTKRILRDKIPPVIEFTKPDPAQTQGYEKNRSYEFKGKITEANLESVTARLLKKNGAGEFEEVEGQSAVLSTDQEDNFSWKVYDLTDAVYKAEVTAADKGGHSTTESSIAITVDNDAPEVSYTAENLKNAEGQTVTAISAGDYYASTQTVRITGSVSEQNYENKEEYVSVSGLDASITFEENTDTFTITPVMQDGETSLTVTVEDKAGNKTETKFTFHRDTTGPVVEIRNPQTDSDNPLDDEEFTFRINATDAGVGVARIYYQFTQSEAEPENWGSGEGFEGGDKYITKSFINGHEAAADSLTEGEWYLHAKAEDKSGNVTAEKPVRRFVIDRAAPAIESVKYGEEELTEAQNFYYDADSFTLTGTVTDTNGLESVKVKGEAVYTRAGNENRTTYSINKAIAIEADKRNEIKVEAEDIAGRKTVKTYYVYRDTQAPVINLNNPAESVKTLTDETYKFEGSVTDAGSGISAAKYKFTKTPFAGETQEEKEEAVISSAEEGTGWSSIADGNIEVTKDLGKENSSNNLEQGKWYLYLYAKDNVSGNGDGHKAVKVKEFWVDRALPQLTDLVPGTTGAKVKKGESLTVSGNASDDNGIEKIEITEGTKKWTIEEVPSGTGGSWTKTIVPGTEEGQIADGTHSLTITVTDKAGRTSSQQRSVIVDTKDPQHGSLTKTTTLENGRTWHNTQFIGIQIEDVRDGDDGSGIASVEYTTGSGDGAQWLPMSGTGTTYTATVKCEKEGANTISVRITDAVGNVTAAGNLTAYVDTKAPALDGSKVNYRDGGFEAVSELLINGENGYVLQIEASDSEEETAGNNSGVASVAYFYSTEANNITVSQADTEGHWNISVPVENGTDKYSNTRTNAIYAVITDNAGNETKERILTVTKDTTPPSVEISSFTKAGTKTNTGTETEPVLTDDVNGKITVSGTASDSNKFGSLTIEYQKSGAEGWTKIADSTSYNWSAELDTDADGFEDNKKYTFRATATDAAGNTNAVTQDVYLNRDSDRPVIKMNQVKSDGSGYLTTNTVYGSVSDDDGEVVKLWVWSKQLKQGAVPSAAPSISNSVWTVPDGWIEFGGNESRTLENNNWQITSDEEDGETTWYWAVADKYNKVFWTGAGDALNRPYITYSDKTKQEDTDGITFEYDTISPEITSLELLRLDTDTYKDEDTQERYAAKDIEEYVENLNLSWSSETNMVFGKDKGLMYVKLEVKEKTGMNAAAPVSLDYLTLGSGDWDGTGPAGSDNDTYTYYLGPFDLSEKTTAAPLTLKFTAKDGANKTGSKEKIITIDNTAEITISDVSPKADEIASGKFTFRGQVSDAQSSVTKVEYYIPGSGERSGLNAAADKEAYLNEKDFIHITTATSIQWSIEFADFNTDVLGYYTKDDGTVDVGENFRAYDIGDNVYRVPVWFKVTDFTGNTGYVTDQSITYDPNEDRPKVYISDPEIKATPEEKGGRFKISGTAQDNEGIAAVYIQTNTGSGWTTSSATGAEQIGNSSNYGFKANNTKNWNYTLDVSGIEDETVVQIRAIAVDSDTSLLSAWTDILSVKVNNDLPFVDGDMWLRLYDSEGNLSVEQKYEPNIYIKGTKDDGSIWKLEGTIATGPSVYLDEMSVTVNSGTSKTAVWNITKDEEAGTAQHSGTLSDPDNTGVLIDFAKSNSEKSLTFSIPVTGSALCRIQIDTTDRAGHTGSEKPEINIDETAPSFADYSDKVAHKILLYQDSYGAGGTKLDNSTRFIQNSNGAQFTLAGKTVETQSGFDKAVIYFKRTGSDGKKRVYNPMEGHGLLNTDNRSDIADTQAAAASGTDGKTIYINDDELPVRPLLTGVTRPDAETLVHEEIKTNYNIRAGGLVYIGGLYRLITEINRQTGTIKFEPETGTDNKQAEFVYAIVVDHNGERSNGNGGVIEEFDDNDGLLESYSGSQTADYRWEATFDSSNIPDGPVDVYVVLFDKAGNTDYGCLTTKTSNNAPRITKVMLGTDLNGNDKYDYGTGEFSTFYAFKDDLNPNRGNTAKGMPVWTLDTSAEQASGKYWTVKKGIAVIPEFVGGTGPFYYVFDKGVPQGEQTLDKVLRTQPKGFDYDSTPPANNPVLIDSGENDKILAGAVNASWTYGSSNTGGSLNIDEIDSSTGEYSVSGETETNPAVVYSFTFWDSTEESTPGLDTGSTILNVYVRQDLEDDTAPSALINPFEWKGTGYSKSVTVTENGVQTDSSSDVLKTLKDDDVLGTKTETVFAGGNTTVTKTVITPKNSLYETSRDNGHIELAGNLTQAVKDAFGEDPKVSGKVTFHGTASDDTRLGSIWFKFDSFTAKSSEKPEGTTDYIKAAWYDTQTASWKTALSNETDPVSIGSEFWEISVTDSSFDQNGHKVDWYLSIDTARIANGVGLNKTLYVMAYDKGNLISSVQTYQMDVVPYVTTFTTSLSSFQSGNPSVYDRTALGHYPVYMTHAQGAGTYDYEIVKVNGFNLDGSSVLFTPAEENATVIQQIKKYTTDATGKYVVISDEDIDEDTEWFYGVKLLDGIKSGEVSVQKIVSASTISSLNNLNNNDAYGTYYDLSSNPAADNYSGCYNRLPNGTNNNLLTDDLILDVWDLNSEAAIPRNNSALDIMMKINPSNKLIGFAFCNGYWEWSMPDEENSYQVWAQAGDFIQCTGFGYDSEGYSYGLCAGGESGYSGGKPMVDACVFLTSHWGTVTGKDVFTGSNNDNLLRIEATGQLSSESDYDLNKTRFKSPSYATIDGDTGYENIYLAFYDDINGEIRFRAGALEKSKTNKTGLGKKDNKYYFGNFVDRLVTASKGVTPLNYEGTAQDCQVVANSKADDVSNGNVLGYSGEYVSIGVTSHNVVVMVWYDSKNNRLLCSYNNNPLALTTRTNTTNWAPAKVIMTGAGKYCNLVVDSDDNIHVAAYDSSQGDLKYAFIKGTTKVNNVDQNIPDYENPKVCKVDTYQSVGKELTIDVAKETINGETYQIPHIGYFGTTPKKPRYAYLANPKKFFATQNPEVDGTKDNDRYSQIWECGIVPTKSTVTIDSNRRINVGVWKTAAGVRTDSSSGTSVATTDNGTCYGNGTNNAVLGYGVKYSPTQDYVETAQMR